MNISESPEHLGYNALVDAAIFVIVTLIGFFLTVSLVDLEPSLTFFLLTENTSLSSQTSPPSHVLPLNLVATYR